jgi:hypothetical protein
MKTLSLILFILVSACALDTDPNVKYIAGDPDGVDAGPYEAALTSCAPSPHQQLDATLDGLEQLYRANCIQLSNPTATECSSAKGYLVIYRIYYLTYGVLKAEVYHQDLFNYNITNAAYRMTCSCVSGCWASAF